MKFSAYLCAAVLLFAAPVAPAFAQATIGQQPVRYVVSPQVPAPGDTVHIEVQGVGTFIGDANISWQVNGKTTLSGIGERALTFTVGGLGSQTTVKVTVNSPSQGTFAQSFVFNPSTVNLLWEADTTAPPFYQGKTLMSGGSTLKVVAIPQVVVKGATVPPSSLSFQWLRNGDPVTEQSGYGRNIFTAVNNELKTSEQISVDVMLAGVTVGHGELTVPVSKPELLLYEQDPLRGVLYDAALTGTITLAGKEATFKAEPYGFANGSSGAGTLLYTWRLNGNTTTGPDSAQGVLTLRQTGSGAGSATLTASLQNTDPNKYLEAASAAIGIIFGGASADTTNAFGL